MPSPPREAAAAALFAVGVVVSRASYLSVAGSGTIVERIAGVSTMLLALLCASLASPSCGNPIVSLLLSMVQGRGPRGLVAVALSAAVQAAAMVAVFHAVQRTAPHLNAPHAMECTKRDATLSSIATTEALGSAITVVLIGISTKLRTPPYAHALALAIPQALYSRPCSNPALALAQFPAHRDPNVLHAYVTGSVTGATLCMAVVLRLYSSDVLQQYAVADGGAVGSAGATGGAGQAGPSGARGARGSSSRGRGRVLAHPRRGAAGGGAGGGGGGGAAKDT